MNNTNTREQSTLWLQAKLFYHVFLHVKLTEFTWKDSDSCKNTPNDAMCTAKCSGRSTTLPKAKG